jgi:hypothetical protein
MQNFKIEIVFMRESKVEGELGSYLHSFDATGDATIPTFIIPNVGERVSSLLGGKDFGGKVIEKLIMYGDKDIHGKSYDMVIRVALTLSAVPDVQIADKMI